MICRKSHKKVDLSSSWALTTRDRLTPELVAALDDMNVDEDWKCLYLLASLSDEQEPEPFVRWLEAQTVQSLARIFNSHDVPFPTEIPTFHSRMIYVLTAWNTQYFSQVDPLILTRLKEEADRRQHDLQTLPQEKVLDDVTNGLMFRPVQGLEKVILVPQYHFQPLNVIYYFGNSLLCHYSSRLYLGDQDLFPTHSLRVIRSLGERNRLRILRYLQHGPRSFIEIVRHLELSKGITHDHISKLRGAGLVYAHLEGENLVEYTLRRRALKQVQHLLDEYIEG